MLTVRTSIAKLDGWPRGLLPLTLSIGFLLIAVAGSAVFWEVHNRKNKLMVVPLPIGLPAEAEAGFRDLLLNNVQGRYSPERTRVIKSEVLLERFSDHVFVRLVYGGSVVGRWDRLMQKALRDPPIQQRLCAIDLRKNRAWCFVSESDFCAFLAEAKYCVADSDDAEKLYLVIGELWGMDSDLSYCHQAVSDTEWKIGLVKFEDGAESWWRIDVNAKGEVIGGSHFHRYHFRDGKQ